MIRFLGLAFLIFSNRFVTYVLVESGNADKTLGQARLTEVIILKSNLLSSLFRAFCTVFGTALATAINTRRIEGTANDMITNAREVLNTAATDHDDAVLLKVVAFTRDIGVDFLLVSETDTCDFTHSRVRFFRGGGVHTGADATTLGAAVESRGFGFVFHLLTSFAN